MVEINSRKAAIVGCGFVGSASAFALMESGLFSEIVLIDHNKEKAEGEALDKFLSDKVFGGQTGTVMKPDPEDVAGFDKYIETYVKAIPAQKDICKAISI